MCHSTLGVREHSKRGEAHTSRGTLRCKEGGFASWKRGILHTILGTRAPVPLCPSRWESGDNPVKLGISL